jgi:hypothetical protein
MVNDIIYYVHEKQEYTKGEFVLYTTLISPKCCVRIIFLLDKRTIHPLPINIKINFINKTIK